MWSLIMFNVVVVSSGVVILPFDNGADAGEYARAWNDDSRRSGSDERVRVMQVAVEDHSWKTRELSRFTNGVYTEVPWFRESWAIVNHFAHISADDDSKVAFTRDGEHGRNDIQTRMNPGRYLTRYHSDTLSEDDIKNWCAKFDAGKHQMQIAMDSDEIQRVYTHGPSSCMSHAVNDYESPCHPVRVYGAGDLGVAYMEDEDRITARCIVYPARKLFSIIYGDASRLQPLLEAAGYTRGNRHDAWDGARLLRVESDESFVVPWLDPPMESVTDDGEHLIIDCSGDICCRNTSGLSEPNSRCDHCEERYSGESYTVGNESWCQGCYEEDSFWCGSCDESCADDDMAGSDRHGTSYCSSCASNMSRCEHCEHLCDDDSMITTVEDTHYCEHCAERHLESTECGEYLRGSAHTRGT
jgi:hypothetical protein